MTAVSVSDLQAVMELMDRVPVSVLLAAPEMLAALLAFRDGFADGSIKWAKRRQSDSDHYHPANVLMSTALAKVEGS